MLALGIAVVAGVCLACGWLFEEVTLVWAALGVSVLGVVLVVARAWRIKKATREAEAVTKPPDSESDSESDSVHDSVSSQSEAEPDDEHEDTVSAPPASEDNRGPHAVEEALPAGSNSSARLMGREGGRPLGVDTSVYVVAGRKRFHAGGCRLMGDRDIEEVTLSEAHDEAFTPCTVCISTEVGELLVRHS